MTQNICFKNCTFNVKGSDSIKVDNMAITAGNGVISVHCKKGVSSSSSSDSLDEYSVTSYGDIEPKEIRAISTIAPVIEPHQSLKDFEKGMRIIWYYTLDKIDTKTPLKIERIGLKEEKKQSDYEKLCSKSKPYYDKCIEYINKANIEKNFIDENHTRLQSLLLKMYNMNSYDKGKITKYGNEVYSYVKSIIGERSKEKLMKVIMISLMRTTKSIKKSLYWVVKNLTFLRENTESKQRLIKMLQLKAYKNNEKEYYRFMKILLTSLEILKKAAELLNPVFEFLNMDNVYLWRTLKFEVITKVTFYGLIYENIVFKECLGEVDRNCLVSQLIFNSNYETSSDDSFSNSTQLTSKCWVVIIFILEIMDST